MTNKGNQKSKSRVMDKSSMLNFDEGCEILKAWLEDKLDCNSVKIHDVVGAKAKFYVKIGSGERKGSHSGYIHVNEDNYGYASPTLSIFINGTRESVSLKEASLSVWGNDAESNPWIKLARERWSNHQKSLAVNSSVEIDPAQAEKMRLEKEKLREEKRIQNEFNEKKDYLKQRLGGIAVSQFIYDISNSHKASIYHQNQNVKRPSEHPYGIKKNINLEKEAVDFLTLPNIQLTTKQVYDFVNSDRFQMPKNNYGFDKNTVIEVMKENSFELSDHIYEQDFKLGTGILPSRDLNGTIVNLQRFLVTPVDGKDKKFIRNGLVVGGAYVFNEDETLKKNDYSPKAIIITEGWATGLSIKKALNDPEIMVVVSWQAGQLTNCVKDFADKYPNATIEIACDNDCKSFIKMNTRQSEKTLLLTKNTGLKATLETLEALKDYKDRIGVLMPRLNYKEMDLQNNLSDFNDIEMKYGVNSLKIELCREINKHIDRMENGIGEVDRVVKMYNNQAIHFADKYQLPIHTIKPNGNFSDQFYKPDGYDPVLRFGNVVDNKKPTRAIPDSNKAKEQKTVEPTTIAPTVVVMDFKSLFDVAVPDAVKTDFDRKAEKAVIEIVSQKEAPIQSPKPQPQQEVKAQINIEQAIKAEPKQNYYLENSPQAQPMINPSDMTEMLYRTNLIGRLFELKKIGDKEAILSASERAEISNQNKLISAIVDPVIGKHIAPMLESSIERLKGSSISDELSVIKKHIGEEYIEHSSQIQEKLKAIQTEVVNAVVPLLDSVGMSIDDTKRVIKDDLMNRDIDTKRLAYKEIRSTLNNLTEQDLPWIKDVKNSLLETYKISKEKALDINQAQPTTMQEKSNDNSMSPR